MKKILMPFLIVLIAIGVIVTLFLSLAQQEHLLVVHEGNHEHKVIDFKPNTYQCPECKMPIETLSFAAEAVLPNGKTFFFDDPGCLILWLEDKELKNEITLWIHTLDTTQWIDAKDAYFSLTDNTPMLYGFGAYETHKEGMIDFETMRLKMLRGENMSDPYIRKKLLGQ